LIVLNLTSGCDEYRALERRFLLLRCRPIDGEFLMVGLSCRAEHVLKMLFQLAKNPWAGWPASPSGKSLRRAIAIFLQCVNRDPSAERNASLQEEHSSAVSANKAQALLRIFQMVQKPVAMDDIERLAVDLAGRVEIHGDDRHPRSGISVTQHFQIFWARLGGRHMASAIEIVGGMVADARTQLQNTLAGYGNSQRCQVLQSAGIVPKVTKRVEFPPGIDRRFTAAKEPCNSAGCGHAFEILAEAAQ